MVQKVIAAAREQIRAAGLLETVRPEPSQVIDREDHWEVLFEKKGSIVEVDGKQIVQKQKPSSLRVVVRKSDMTATLVPGR